jgi:hypothetical protein
MRARLQEWLSGMGFNPILSEGEGFPHADGMPPYASCLKTMDECTMVIGVIERQYGTPFDDWGPFPQYKGLAPTHAELRHALNTGKRVLIYVQDGTWNFYDVWRRNPDAFAKGAPHGLDVRTLEVLHELKTRTPEPWLSRYDNASSVVASLKSEVINHGSFASAKGKRPICSNISLASLMRRRQKFARVLPRLADERVNLKRDDAKELREQANRLREKLENYLEEHPDFELRKMLLSGSLAKGTALKSISDIDVGCYVSSESAPEKISDLVDWLAKKLRTAFPNFKPEQVKPKEYSVAVNFISTGNEVDTFERTVQLVSSMRATPPFKDGT